MNRTAHVKNSFAGVRTTNGVDTFTASVLATPVKTYTPLENGFNLELANDVFDKIKDNPLLWDQGSWRQVVLLDPNTTRAEANKRLQAFQTEINAPICGTAMCVAGWSVELAKMDWVIDGVDLARSTGAQTPPWPEYAELVIVPRGSDVNEDEEWGEGWSLPEEVDAQLRERGFSAETHKLVSVSAAGKDILGVGTDPLDLFAGSNDLERIRATIDYYAQNGSQLDREQVLDFLESQGSHACTCSDCMDQRGATV